MALGEEGQDPVERTRREVDPSRFSHRLVEVRQRRGRKFDAGSGEIRDDRLTGHAELAQREPLTCVPQEGDEEVGWTHRSSAYCSGESLGPTLVDWIKGGNVGSDDWVEIDVYVTEDGTIRLSWNGKFLVQVQDASLIDQPYFGLMLITKENGAARVKYDYFKVD